jgi:hypothetical protein
MKNNKVLISVLGWEERSFLGIKECLALFDIRTITLLVFKEYLKYTSLNLTNIQNLCKEENIKLNTIEISYSKTSDAWIKMGDLINNKNIKRNNTILDMSTMPRETIWSLLFFSNKKKIILQYIYFKPQMYGEWLCKEPDKPRLLYKHSGVAEFGKPTALIILTGYDYDRTNQLVRFYEPAVTALGIQKGLQFDNQNRNIKEQHIAECKGQTEIEIFDIDAYIQEDAMEILELQISRFKDKYNIIISSLGPKISAVSIYELFLNHPQIALTYVPTKEYNVNYSTGIILEPIIGKIRS